MKTVKALFLAGAATAAFYGFSTPAQAQSDPLIGQITPFAGTFCPRGWATAQGQLLPISSNTALFSILGTMYGGDGRTTFALPDLQGRRATGAGVSPSVGTYRNGMKNGRETFTLTLANLPTHTHFGTIGASGVNADTNNPVRNSFAISTGTNAYLDGDPAVNNMNAGTLRINPAGGNQSTINKVSPYQVVNWCVALVGVFPSRN